MNYYTYEVFETIKHTITVKAKDKDTAEVIICENTGLDGKGEGEFESHNMKSLGLDEMTCLNVEPDYEDDEPADEENVREGEKINEEE